MEKALRLQEERSMRPGRGNHQFWYVSAAYSLVSTKLEPQRAEILQIQSTDRISKLYFKILGSQEESKYYLVDDVSLPPQDSQALGT